MQRNLPDEAPSNRRHTWFDGHFQPGRTYRLAMLLVKTKVDSNRGYLAGMGGKNGSSRRSGLTLCLLYGCLQPMYAGHDGVVFLGPVGMHVGHLNEQVTSKTLPMQNG